MDASHKTTVQRSQFEIDRDVAELATRQHGVISRKQLEGLGMASTTITRRINAKRLHPLWPGVYAVGHSDVSRAGRRMAAVLVCGKTACLSHRTAGHQWNVRDAPAGKIDVTLAARSKPKHDGIRAHLSRLPEDEIAEVDGIPTTSLARTVVDLSSTDLSDFGMRVVLAKAEREKLDWHELHKLVARYPQRPGVPRLRRVMAEDQLVGLPNGPLEIRLGEWLTARGLPLPEFNQPIQIHGIWVRPDALWRKQKVLAEMQSRRHHDGWLGRLADAERLTALTAAGYQAIQITARALNEGTRLERDLRAVLALPL
jgi:hypothetical protein